MILNSLTIRNFRNHSYLTYDFAKHLNVIVGPNGVGKTNIVESINYLSIARSFRTQEDYNLIKRGEEKAEIYALVQEGEIKRKINIILKGDGRNVFINNKAVRKLSELSKAINVIFFEPKDVQLFKGPPKERRDFLNISISKKSDIYFDYILKYEKALKQRNEILKADKIDKDLLDATTEILIKLSGPIIFYRQMYIKDINDILIKITRALTRTCEKLEVSYKPFIDYNKDFEKNAAEAFEKNKEADIKKKATTIGIHREDFKVLMDGKDVAQYGSQGENRLAALSVKLSPYFLIEDKDKKPIVVLDDILSELDEEHSKLLISFVKKFEQVFITGTNVKIDGASTYELKRKQKEVF